MKDFNSSDIIFNTSYDIYKVLCEPINHGSLIQIFKTILFYFLNKILCKYIVILMWIKLCNKKKLKKQKHRSIIIKIM